nr:MAG TPA: hypothetical protein [Caudoviricetes sp.]
MLSFIIYNWNTFLSQVISIFHVMFASMKSAFWNYIFLISFFYFWSVYRFGFTTIFKLFRLPSIEVSIFLKD